MGGGASPSFLAFLVWYCVASSPFGGDAFFSLVWVVLLSPSPLVGVAAFALLLKIVIIIFGKLIVFLSRYFFHDNGNEKENHNFNCE